MSRQQANSQLLKRIRSLKRDHPLWGYRRVWAYLCFRENMEVNKKRIYRLMKEHNLLVKKNNALKACRTPLRSKPRAHRPNHIWGIDMTKIMLPTWGWLYLHVVIDWHTKKIVGYNLSISSKTSDWLHALGKAVNTQFPKGARDKQSLFLVSDNGSQPTSMKFMKACQLLEIKQIFASYNNPKGNADTERVIRTIKEDLIWINDFQSPFELQDALVQWMDNYNNDYPHSTLKYKTPCEFEQLCLTQSPHL